MERDDWVATLEYWQTCGVDLLSGDRLDFPSPTAPPPHTPGPNPATPPFQPFKPPESHPARPAQHPPPAGASQDAVQKKASPVLSSAEGSLPALLKSDQKKSLLTQREEEASNCRRCELHLTRSQAVFGVGDADAPVVFVGEGPGADEDRMGEPFVGAAGKLLDKMLYAVGLTREQVYIANVIKCRPPGNRNPLPEEVALCQHFLIDQLQTIQPKAIFCLGKFALLTLMGYDGPVGKARNQPFSWQGIPVIASFHPAYYLRTPSKKGAAWQDLIRLQKLLESLEKKRGKKG
ncbi:MAG: uracil-DNA glycosylase [Magnetococcales bacterium]|nr:uracil-DNA glycosylase [Magnetococcales bacterium]